MFGLGMPELLVIGVIMLLLFGRRLPEVGKSLGKGIIEFKKGISGVEEEVNKAAMQPPKQSAESLSGYQQQTGQQYPQQQPNPYAAQAMSPQNGYPQQPYPQQYQQLPNQPPQVPQQAGQVGTVSRADSVH